MDTISFQPVFLSGNNCIGDSIRLSLLSSPFIQYRWTTPNNIVSSGNSIAINPIAYTDEGNYIIEQFIEIAGCRDTLSRLFNFATSSCILPIELVYFNVECENTQLNFS